MAPKWIYHTDISMDNVISTDISMDISIDISMGISMDISMDIVMTARPRGHMTTGDLDSS